MGWLVGVGALSAAAQVVLLRELNAAFYGVELLYVLGLAVWLVWVALGTLLAARCRYAASTALGWSVAAVAPAVLGAVVFLRGATSLLRGVRGAYLPFWQELAVMAAALGPACCLFGAAFQWGARQLVARGDTLARAYGLESAGALAGGIATFVVVHAGVPTVALAIAVAAAALLAPLAPPVLHGDRRASVAAVVVLGLAAGALGRSSTLDEHLTRWQQPELVDVRDSPYARLAVTRRGDQVALFENNALVFDTESPDAETFAHLVLLHHPDPARVLLIGGGPAGLAAAARSHGAARIDDVELDPVLVDVAARHVPSRVWPVESGVEVIVDEPRRFLRRAGHYDVVLVGMPEPDTGAANRFYTREFFALAARHLAPRGVLGLRLRGSENVRTPAEVRRLAAVERALRAVFSDVLVLPGPTLVLVASATSLARDPEVLVARLAARRLNARVVTPMYLRYLATTDRSDALAAEISRSTEAANTDLAPLCYQEAAMLWLGKFWPRIARLDLQNLRAGSPAGRAWRGALLTAWILAVWACRRRPGLRRGLLAFVAGLAGMALETVWLLHYQLTEGALFQDLAALVSAFMAGLAGGALAARRVGLVPEGAGRRPAPRRVGVGLLVALAALGTGSAALVQLGSATSLASAAAALAATGAIVAALFAYASVAAVGDPRRVIAPLYAADLAGGCVGSLAATLLLVPTAGLAVTAAWVAVLAVFSLPAI